MSANLALLSLPSACNVAGFSSSSGCKYISGSKRSCVSPLQDEKQARKNSRPCAKKTSGSIANMSDPTRQRPTSKTPPSSSRVPSSSASGPNAHPDEDWTKITDLSERRRIQNRIAQRNFRQKMKYRVGHAKAPRPTSADRPREEPRESRERDPAAQHAFAGHSTSLSHATTFGPTTPNVTEAPVPWQQTPHCVAESPISAPPQLYSPPPIDYSFYTSSAEQYQPTQPVYAPYQSSTATTYSPYIQYPGQPGYYTNQPPQPTHSLQTPHYQQPPPQLYTPEPLPSTYDVDQGATDEIDWPYGRSEVYQAGISPQPYSYQPSPSGSASGYEDPDSRLSEQQSPRSRPHQ